MIGGVQYYVEESGETAGQRRSGAGRTRSRSGGQLKVPPADIYEVLVAAVLPDARPAEVFLYGEAPGLRHDLHHAPAAT